MLVWSPLNIFLFFSWELCLTISIPLPPSPYPLLCSCVALPSSLFTLYQSSLYYSPHQDPRVGPGCSRWRREHLGARASQRHQSISGPWGGHSQDRWTHQRGAGIYQTVGRRGPYRKCLSKGECDVTLTTVLWFAARQQQPGNCFLE